MSKRINTKKTTVKTVSTEIKDAVEKTEVVSTAEEKKKADKPKAEEKKKADKSTRKRAVRSKTVTEEKAAEPKTTIKRKKQMQQKKK